MKLEFEYFSKGDWMNLVTNPVQVLLISPSGRGRDNLLVLLESLSVPLTVRVVETCQDAEILLDSERHVIVMVDYRFPDEIMEQDISKLILHDSVHHIVLLQSRNAPKCHFTHYSTSEVVYNDLSVDMLNSLMKNIEQV